MARIGAPRGVAGYLKLHSYSGEFGHLEGLGEVLLVMPGEPAGPGGQKKRARIIARESGDWGMSVLFEGYPSPEKARALTGFEIMVPPEAASPLREGEWYISDLIGLDLVSGGRAVARVEGVLDGAADPLLECRVRGPSGKVVLVPFRKEFIGAVDTDSGTMELLDEGLLE